MNRTASACPHGRFCGASLRTTRLHDGSNGPGGNLQTPVQPYDEELSAAKPTDSLEAWKPGSLEAWDLELRGRYLMDQERSQVNKAVELDPGTPFLRSGVAYHYALAGRSDEARELLASPDAATWPLPEVGLIYAALGDIDRAYEYMYRAQKMQDHSLYYLPNDPAADPMRSDARWPALMAALRPET